jgi:O-antigen ligase
VLVLALGERAYGPWVPRWRNALALPVALLLLWTAVSALASPDPAASVWGADDSLNGMLTTAVLALLFVAAAQSVDAAGVRTALSVLFFGGGGLVLAYGAVQLADRVAPSLELDPVPWVNALGENAIWSTLGNPNDLAGFLAVLLPVGLVLLGLERRPALRAVTASMLAVLAVELAATTSRGGLLAATAALALVAAWSGPVLRRSVRGAAGAGAIAAAVGVALLLAGGHAERRLDDLVRTGEGTTVSLRVELWGTAWRMAAERPVSGVGPDGFGRSFDAFRSDRFVEEHGPDLLATDAHNLLLTAVATQGVPGLLTQGYLLTTALLLVVRARRRLGGEAQTLLVAVTGALVAYIVQALFNRQDVVLDFCFWVLLGLVCALARTSAATGPPQGNQGDERSQGADDEGDPGDRALSVVPLT